MIAYLPFALFGHRFIYNLPKIEVVFGMINN